MSMIQPPPPRPFTYAPPLGLPRILHHDAHILAIDKPSGLLSVPGKHHPDSALARIQAEFPDVQIVPYIGDICDTRRMEAVFAQERPSTVFHAAAHKHVPLMEANPGEAIKNNVGGTKVVADAER